MVEQIYFNNRYSYDDFGLLLVESPIIPLSYENIELIDVPGRSGTLTKRLGTFNDKVIRFKFKLIDIDSHLFEDVLINITYWLNTINDNNLIINNSEYSYRVKHIEMGDIQRELNWYGDFEVIFTCEPFKYKDKKFKVISNHDEIVYLGTIKTEPTITIVGTGDINLTINDKTLILKNIEDQIVIDSSRMICYKIIDGLYVNMNSNINGEYPIFYTGVNKINWIGDITNIKIEYETKYL